MGLKISVCLVSLNWQREVGRAEATKQAGMELWLPNFCSFEWKHRLQGASEKQFALERHLSNIRPVMHVYFCKEKVYFLDLCFFLEIKTIYSSGILDPLKSELKACFSPAPWVQTNIFALDRRYWKDCLCPLFRLLLLLLATPFLLSFFSIHLTLLVCRKYAEVTMAYMTYHENFKITKNSDRVRRLNNISDPPAKLKID